MSTQPHIATTLNKNLFQWRRTASADITQTSYILGDLLLASRKNISEEAKEKIRKIQEYFDNVDPKEFAEEMEERYPGYIIPIDEEVENTKRKANYQNMLNELGHYPLFD